MKITKIIALGLPMLSIAPLVSLGTNTSASLVKNTKTVKSEKSYYSELRSISFGNNDLLIGCVNVTVGEWDEYYHVCNVVLDIKCDDGKGHDEGWNGIMHYEFSVMPNPTSTRISSKNGKAYFEFAIKNQNLKINTLSAYSAISSAKNIKLI